MAKKIPTRWMQMGPLSPWMMSYCQWLVGYPGAELSKKGVYRSRLPSGLERQAKMEALTHRSIRPEYVAHFEKRADVAEYFDKLRADAAFHARELAKDQVAANLEARAVALERASGRVVMPDGTVKYAEMNLSEVRQLTAPYLDLAFPKVEKGGEKAPRIVIQIGSPEAMKQIKAALEEDVVDGEFEVEELPKQLPAGEEEENDG
jgi:hypothetical protein